MRAHFSQSIRVSLPMTNRATVACRCGTLSTQCLSIYFGDNAAGLVARLGMLKTLCNVLSTVFAILCMVNAVLCIQATMNTHSFGPIKAVAILAALAIGCRAVARSKTVDSFLAA